MSPRRAVYHESTTLLTAGADVVAISLKTALLLYLPCMGATCIYQSVSQSVKVEQAGAGSWCHDRDIGDGDVALPPTISSVLICDLRYNSI